MEKPVEVQGHCDARFAAVRDAFASNFREGREVGASFAATVDGEFVVDIWAGHADEARTRPWERDTIVNVYSTTKVMTAIAALILVDRGAIDLDAPVATYWPEFAQAGKEKLPVRYLFSHMSGLAGFETPITLEMLYDWDECTRLLAAQAPWWEPGARCGYQAMTHGYLLGELVRRVSGKSLGTFFRHEVAQPLGADFHIGLDESLDARVGELIPPPEVGWGEEPEPGSIGAKLGNGPSTDALVAAARTRAWRAAEIPAANGHGNARSVARVASAMACGGAVDGVRLMSRETVDKAIEEQLEDFDLTVPEMRVRYGLGFALRCDSIWMPNIGPSPRAFFWGGYGGSFCVMDPDARVSYGYVMNRMLNEWTGEFRSDPLAAALYESL